jgi:hypothetical protein
VQGERVIAWDAEDVVDADVVQPAKNVLDYGDALSVLPSLIDRRTPVFRRGQDGRIISNMESGLISA